MRLAKAIDEESVLGRCGGMQLDQKVAGAKTRDHVRRKYAHLAAVDIADHQCTTLLREHLQALSRAVAASNNSIGNAIGLGHLPAYTPLLPVGVEGQDRLAEARGTDRIVALGVAEIDHRLCSSERLDHERLQLFFVRSEELRSRMPAENGGSRIDHS